MRLIMCDDEATITWNAPARLSWAALDDNEQRHKSMFKYLNQLPKTKLVCYERTQRMLEDMTQHRRHRARHKREDVLMTND